MSHSNSNLSDNETEVVLSTQLTSHQRQTDRYYNQLQSIMIDNGWQLQKDNGEDPDFNGNEYFTHPTYNGEKAHTFTYQTYYGKDIKLPIINYPNDPKGLGCNIEIGCAGEHMKVVSNQWTHYKDTRRGRRNRKNRCKSNKQKKMKQIFKQMKENNEKQESKYGFRFS